MAKPQTDRNPHKKKLRGTALRCRCGNMWTSPQGFEKKQIPDGRVRWMAK